ncbi:FAD:protein FMN transferase [Kocuria coralli]|uniref:FAD:protein FMN transferase n=1 Tax=Kocuria coralli TaxID=1461025 RepID=A0A5J5L2F5_9MICC|nr:FAD:protein FMN transferase [Kocuria coralli]KAA9395395.1 FAD:protein FMN transferase [Kocuria coralli]
MTISTVRRGSGLVSAGRVVHAIDPLTRLVACSVADRVLEDLSSAVQDDRCDSEIALLNSRAVHDDVSIMTSPALTAILRRAQEAARMSGGLVDPVVGMALTDGRQGHAGLGPVEPYRFDADQHRLDLRRGTVLDLWDIGCAWAAEEIVAQVVREDPAATLAVVVDLAVVSVGAAWEISEALEETLPVLDSPLRCGLRSFAILDHSGPRTGTQDEALGDATEVPSPAPGTSAEAAWAPWWERAVVGAGDAVQALTFGLMAERLGDGISEHIVDAGGQAEFVGPPGEAAPRHRLRTPGWVPRSG